MRTVFDLAKKEARIKELERESQRTDFWQAKERAIKITHELSELREEAGEFNKLKTEFSGLKESQIEEFEKKLEQKEFQIFLSGEYDKNDAILSIYAGAGGQDSQDWATLLLRMYERYCLSKRYRTKILHQSFGEGGGPEGRIGTKSVTLEIKGNYAFGFLKKERQE